MELEQLNAIEKATRYGRAEVFRIGVAVIFLAGVMLYVRSIGADAPNMVILVAAAMIGGYMAMNIGANDVANNVGPAVGSKALTLAGAIAIAAIFEASGALIAGGDVVSTIKKGIIDPALIGDPDTFIWLMIAALLAAALWLNAATYVGAPVSTTHSIVGGVMGAGIAAGGVDIVDWSQFGQIVASWVISPVLGGAIAALTLYLIKRRITYKREIAQAARYNVPLFVAIMAGVFATYLVIKGLGKVVDIGLLPAIGFGALIGIIVWRLTKWLVTRPSVEVENSKAGVDSLFTSPLIFSAALLSFAHGANDVANAVGPLAAINETILHGGVVAQAAIPGWVMWVGALGIALGLALFGPKLIRTVGSEITELDRMRAFCVAMAAAVTVIIASQLGLPVSSTHIAIGGVFGVGFLREHLKTTYREKIAEIEVRHAGEDREKVERVLKEFEEASFEEKGEILKKLKSTDGRYAPISKSERKSLKKLYRQDLVKRSAVLKIVAAWLITVPLSALLAAMLFFTIRGMLLP
ncbi:inorganic phosphate transporter [Marinobacter sp. M216]|uniref:Phosphate transporter n=1 Tax=Marinobacter albus TaxID=3030833 RepID=A0ABT7HBD2_9GAMM|nr:MULTISPECIES: inorganic phosphate transporter [unclassified Marinobacter]MBW7470849.1 inorganic phosphate transporter [Marinobacter sp. F4218]MDK9556881.1 inorganic phosphate transporter [Marinobacter sp. M216]